MAFADNKLSFGRKHKAPLHLLFALKGAVSVKITAFCLLALLFTGCQNPAIKAPESTVVKEETVQPATTAPEKPVFW